MNEQEIDMLLSRQLSRSIQRNSRLENALRAAEAHIDKHLCTEGVEGAAAVLAIISNALKGGDDPAASLPRPTASELLGALNAAIVALKSRDQSSFEMKVLEGLKVAMAQIEAQPRSDHEPVAWRWRTRRHDNSAPWRIADKFSPSLMEKCIEMQPLYAAPVQCFDTTAQCHGPDDAFCMICNPPVSVTRPHSP